MVTIEQDEYTNIFLVRRKDFVEIIQAVGDDDDGICEDVSVEYTNIPRLITELTKIYDQLNKGE